MFKDDKPKDTEKYGHGRIWCSCGTPLSVCGCHTNYGIRVKECSKCQEPPPVKKKKYKKKHKILSKPSTVIPVNVMPKKEVQKLLLKAKEKIKGNDTSEDDWMVEPENVKDK